MSLVNVIFTPIAPLTSPQTLVLPSSTPLSSLPTHITSHLAFPNLHPSHLLIRHQSRLLSQPNTLQSLQNAPQDPIFLTVSIRLPGGKGGFGSQLRAQGGRMSARKKRGPQDKSAMRDLSGRRLKAVQQAKELADYLAKAPALERRAREERRRKLEGVLAANPAAGIKMDDHAYWDDKERLVEGVKSAVREAIREAGVRGVSVDGTLSVQNGGVKRDVKFSGFDDEFEDSSEEEGEDGLEDGEDEEETDAEEEGVEEDEDDDYEESTEEEPPAEDDTTSRDED